MSLEVSSYGSFSLRPDLADVLSATGEFFDDDGPYVVALKGGAARAVLVDVLSMPQVGIRDIDLCVVSMPSQAPSATYRDRYEGNGDVIDAAARCGLEIDCDTEDDFYDYEHSRDIVANQVLVWAGGKGAVRVAATSQAVADLRSGVSRMVGDNPSSRVALRAVRFATVYGWSVPAEQVGKVGELLQEVSGFEVGLQLVRMVEAGEDPARLVKSYAQFSPWWEGKTLAEVYSWVVQDLYNDSWMHPVLRSVVEDEFLDTEQVCPSAHPSAVLAFMWALACTSGQCSEELLTQVRDLSDYDMVRFLEGLSSSEVSRLNMFVSFLISSGVSKLTVVDEGVDSFWSACLRQHRQTAFEGEDLSTFEQWEDDVENRCDTKGHMSARVRNIRIPKFAPSAPSRPRTPAD